MSRNRFVLIFYSHRSTLGLILQGACAAVFVWLAAFGFALTAVRAAPLADPIIGVAGTCDTSGNSVFTITNTGDAMTENYTWEIYQNSVFLTSGVFLLAGPPGPGNSQQLTINGLYGDVMVAVKDGTTPAAVQIASETVFCENHPKVTINQAPGQADPANSSPINFKVVFESAVTGFDGSDVTISGMAGTPGITVTGGPAVYNVAVTGMAVGETVTATLAADVALSTGAGGGYGNKASTSTDNQITYDGPPIIGVAGSCDLAGNSVFTITNTGGAMSSNYTWELYQNSVFLTSGVFLLSGSPGPGNSQQLTINGLYGDVMVVIKNGTTPAAVQIASETVFCENHPKVTINQAPGQADPTNSSPINFKVVFESAVTGFDGSDVTISGMAATPGITVTGGPAVYNVAVTGMAVGETVTATLAADVALSSGAGGGYGNKASTSTDNHVAYHPDYPGVTIDQAAGQPDPTNGSPINFDVVFTEAVSGFDSTDVTISGMAGAPGVTVTDSGDHIHFTVAVTGMAGGETVVATIPAHAAQDVDGNLSYASTSSDHSVTYDSSQPTVTINQKTSAPAQADPTSSSPVNFTVTFSEVVTDFDDAADVTLGGTAGATTAVISGGPTIYNVAVSGMTGGGTVIASIPAGAAQDTAANGNTSSTSTDNTVIFTVNTTTTITSDSPDPSTVGQAVTVNFTVIAALGSNPSTGNVTVSDSGGATPCVGAVTAGSGTCNITLTTSGTHTLTATYAGSGAFNGSSDTETHSVSITLAVNTFADELNTNGNCSLREAIRAANTNAAVDACPAGSATIVDNITLATGTYTLTRSGVDDTAVNGDLDITGDLRIIGAGAVNTFIAGLSTDRVFQIVSGTVQMDNLTIKNGHNAIGAGILNAGNLTLNSVTVTANTAATPAHGTSQGAGIHNTGTLTLNNSTVSSNTASSGAFGISRGGGIYNNGGTVTLNSCTVTGNKAVSGIRGTSQGGGIYTTGGSTTLNSTTPSGNTVAAGIGGSSAGPNTYP